MRKMIKLQQKNRKLMPNKANISTPKHLVRRPSLQDLVERTITRADVGALTTDSKTQVFENPPVTVPFDLLLAASKILSRGDDDDDPAPKTPHDDSSTSGI
eukprot:CAMPEP_0113654672 /NCGR_PEP_ID=MMETSP0017_2-20120614/29281_1 /TAXON_ID=2856 /ORGANISM="Cylindrotheca closterium" /LENGTH=100 /DNA_ID=CAMNT_0000567835 /DNA_START=215 /DNA_END=514 /DNA_ORIENTATION=- /assembly_acc=CAM_ASM_000147